MPTDALISVVVPTRNRPRRVARLLRALREQDLAGLFDVVLVDDGSHRESADDLDRVLSETDVPARLTRLPRRSGPAVARNRGWRSSAAPLIAFTDDDCRPGRQWLTALVAALGNHDFVQGRTRPDPDDASPLGPFDRTIEVGGENGFYETSNMGYRRELLESLGGFDEGFPYAAGEDTDLGLRARERGARFAFAGDAVVDHDVVRPGLVGFLRNTRRWAGVVRVVRLHPDMKRFFRRGPLWLDSHYVATMAAGGIIFALTLMALRPRWVPVALVLLAPYAWHRPRIRSHHRGRARWSISLLGVLVADLLEVAVHLWAVFRYRRLRQAARPLPARPASIDGEPTR